MIFEGGKVERFPKNHIAIYRVITGKRMLDP